MKVSHDEFLINFAVASYLKCACASNLCFVTKPEKKTVCIVSDVDNYFSQCVLYASE